MTARISVAEARALGLQATPKRKRTTRREVKGAPYFTRCKTCGVELRTRAAEDRHLEATGHARYELVLGL